MLSLSNVCRQYYRDSVKTCLPVNILLLDFSKIDRKLKKLKKQEEAVKAQQDADKKLIAEAQERLQVLRSKMRQLRKQRKLLKQKEADVFKTG
jgi:chromosome segregation ATPase